MIFEESPDVFWQRFSEYAITGEILPVPYGYPLLEVITTIGAVYAFDRGAPPAPTGFQEVLFAGAVKSFKNNNEPKGMQQIKGGYSILKGKVLRELEDETYLFDVGILIILNSEEPLQVGVSLEVVIEPPLMIFRKEV